MVVVEDGELNQLAIADISNINWEALIPLLLSEDSAIGEFINEFGLMQDIDIGKEILPNICPLSFALQQFLAKDNTSLKEYFENLISQAFVEKQEEEDEENLNGFYDSDENEGYDQKIVGNNKENIVKKVGNALMNQIVDSSSQMNFSSQIPGYDKMNPTKQKKAREKLQLQQSQMGSNITNAEKLDNMKESNIISTVNSQNKMFQTQMGGSNTIITEKKEGKGIKDSLTPISNMDYSSQIPGYDKMNPTKQKKAREKLQLQQSQMNQNSISSNTNPSQSQSKNENNENIEENNGENNN